MKKLICMFMVVMFVLSFALCGCSGSDTNTTNATKTEAVGTEAGNPVDEAGAKEIAFADAGITESAAENLTVKFENNSYIIAFEWSGFDYQYTIDASTGEMTEVLFDGSVVE